MMVAVMMMIVCLCSGVLQNCDDNDGIGGDDGDGVYDLQARQWLYIDLYLICSLLAGSVLESYTAMTMMMVAVMMMVCLCSGVLQSHDDDDGSSDGDNGVYDLQAGQWLHGPVPYPFYSRGPCSGVLQSHDDADGNGSVSVFLNLVSCV